jgi:intracellular multiplication protein IcmV
MKATRRIGRVLKPLVNVKLWMGLSQLIVNAKAILRNFNDMKVRRPAVRKETFEEAVARLNFSEDDIKNRMRSCLKLAIIYYFASLLFLVYTIYMMVHLQLGMVLGLLITTLMAVFAYREHFWYFQLKTRRLGNSFRNWLTFVFRGRK